MVVPVMDALTSFMRAMGMPNKSCMDGASSCSWVWRCLFITFSRSTPERSAGLCRVCNCR